MCSWQDPEAEKGILASALEYFSNVKTRTQVLDIEVFSVTGASLRPDVQLGPGAKSLKDPNFFKFQNWFCQIAKYVGQHYSDRTRKMRGWEDDVGNWKWEGGGTIGKADKELEANSPNLVKVVFLENCWLIQFIGAHAHPSEWNVGYFMGRTFFFRN